MPSGLKALEWPKPPQLPDFSLEELPVCHDAEMLGNHVPNVGSTAILIEGIPKGQGEDRNFQKVERGQ